MAKYNCVFKPKHECPVKKQYKLQPESLVRYCKICYLNPINKQEPQREKPLFSELGPQLLETYLTIDKEERESFLNAIKIVSEIQALAKDYDRI